MIIVDSYTGSWQQALTPRAPRCGSAVRVGLSPDGREWDDFRRVIRDAGLDLRWERWMPRARQDVYTVVRGVK
jgi:hypothetical protein